MEIPVVNRIIDFESNLNNLPALHNPSLLSQVSAVSGIEKLHQAYSFWKWGALILALIASFTTIIKKLNLWILRLQKHIPLASEHQHLLDDTDFDSDTDTSCSSSDDEEPELDEDDEKESKANQDDFRVRGSSHVYIDEQWQNRNMGLRRRRRRSIGDFFPWSELTGGKSVVKLWDNLGLGLGLNVEDDDASNISGNMLTIYDMNNEREIGNIATIFRRKFQIPDVVATSSSWSPAVIFSASENDGGGVALSGWDTRIGSKIPAILAEWSPKLGNIVGLTAGGVAKLYVRDNVNSALTVGDMRRVKSPLDDVTENDVDTWWDADAVIVTEECFQEST